MQRAAYGPALVEVLKDRVLSVDDVERQLPIIYLANEILFNRYEGSDFAFIPFFYSALKNLLTDVRLDICFDICGSASIRHPRDSDLF